MNVNVFSVGEEQKANPGAVEAVVQHPTDADKVPHVVSVDSHITILRKFFVSQYIYGVVEARHFESDTQIDNDEY